MADSAPPRPRWQRPAQLGVVIGALYGIVMRLLAQSADGALAVMTLAFLMGAPFVMGVISVWRLEPITLGTRILLPWLPILIATLAAAALFLEGGICLAMGLPMALAGGTIGGLAEGLFRRALRGRATGNLALAAMLALPFLSTLEAREPAPVERRHVTSRVTIAAPPSAIWREIASVREIGAAERHWSPIHWIGFPHPLAATLSGSGAGSVRRATFERGLVFIETVTEWEAGRVLAFTFDAQTDEIPQTTLDPHVTVGGEFFDVLEGRYEIVPLEGGACELRLSSRHRLSTRFNPYSALWSDWVMSEIQRTILAVIRERCESDGARGHASDGRARASAAPRRTSLLP